MLPSQSVSGDEFGTAIDLDGDLLAIGDPFHDGTKEAASLFERQGDLWVEVLAGVSVYLRAIEADPGASSGFSFTPGLRMDLGND